MKVNQLANELSITADTVRFYTRIGLLNPNKSPVNGYKIYNGEDKSRMQFILSARKLDFSVDEIKVIFFKTDHGESACHLVRALVKQKLDETQQQFNEMVKLRARLSQAVEQWSTMADNLPTGNMVCNLIEGTNQTDSSKSSVAQHDNIKLMLREIK
ncbi:MULTISPECIES: MerR family transcriptional regulator [Shewanella]|uniref:MerR family transcriptional regulator n=1 Tax=Shewanella TaxID=22 RepID=UPI001CF80417|nr:MerR family DNA-binding protein [Shewanella glacialimarina]UCX05563.1 MerR family transcriptional regulator [Shewanella glacialimarina]